jgi:hypothetical protein
MRRPKKKINGWMLRQRGIEKRRSVAFQSSGRGPVRQDLEFPNPMRNAREHIAVRPFARNTALDELPKGHDIKEYLDRHGRIKNIIEQVDDASKIRDPFLQVEFKRYWLSEVHGHGIETFQYVKLQENALKTQWLRMYFSGQVAVFVRFDHGKLEVSMKYGGPAKALEYYKLGPIRCWRAIE